MRGGGLFPLFSPKRRICSTSASCGDSPNGTPPSDSAQQRHSPGGSKDEKKSHQEKNLTTRKTYIAPVVRRHSSSEARPTIYDEKLAVLGRLSDEVLPCSSRGAGDVEQEGAGSLMGMRRRVGSWGECCTGQGSDAGKRGGGLLLSKGVTLQSSARVLSKHDRSCFATSSKFSQKNSPSSLLSSSPAGGRGPGVKGAERDWDDQQGGKHASSRCGSEVDGAARESSLFPRSTGGGGGDGGPCNGDRQPGMVYAEVRQGEGGVEENRSDDATSPSSGQSDKGKMSTLKVANRQPQKAPSLVGHSVVEKTSSAARPPPQSPVQEQEQQGSRHASSSDPSHAPWQQGPLYSNDCENLCAPQGLTEKNTRLVVTSVKEQFQQESGQSAGSPVPPVSGEASWDGCRVPGGPRSVCKGPEREYVHAARSPGSAETGDTPAGRQGDVAECSPVGAESVGEVTGRTLAGDQEDCRRRGEGVLGTSSSVEADLTDMSMMTPQTSEGQQQDGQASTSDRRSSSASVGGGSSSGGSVVEGPASAQQPAISRPSGHRTPLLDTPILVSACRASLPLGLGGLGGGVRTNGFSVRRRRARACLVLYFFLWRSRTTASTGTTTASAVGSS